MKTRSRNEHPFLTLLLILSVAAPAALFAFFAWHSYQTTMQTASDRADRFAFVIREHALKVFETIGLTLQSVDRRLQNTSWEEIRTSQPLWAELRDAQQRHSQIGAVFVAAPDGTVALTTRVFSPPVQDFSDRDYFSEQKNRDAGLYIGRAYIGKISSQPIFNFSIRKSSPTGAFDGVVGISAYVRYFHEYYRTIGNAADNFAITLMREDGQVLVRYPASTTPVQVPSDSSILEWIRAKDRGSFTVRSPIDNIDRVASYAKIPAYPVYALYSIDQSSIVRRWLHEMIPGALLAFLATLALSSLSWNAIRSAQRQQQSIAVAEEANLKLQAEMARRERAESSLMQAQRLEAVGQLTGGIAHDFNNLLMVITGNLDLAERRMSDALALKRKLQTIRYATDRAKALTQQLLGFARRHAPDAKTIDLNQALEKAKSLIAYSLPSNVAVSFDQCEEACPVKIDLSELEAAILNLVGNARDAMPDGGAVHIATRQAGPSPRTATSSVEFEIRDTGQGMPPEIARRVFEPFFTTKAAGKGTGLGLSQVYGFVQQSGGTVEVQSEVGKGTSIVMRFPRSSGMPAAVEPTRATPSNQETALTVLIVEKRREQRQVSMAMMEDLGHQVLVARNSHEALALLHAGYPIDVLFTDVTLADGMSGVELAEQAVTSVPQIKVILTTGHPGRADLLKRIDFAVLAKPYTREGLASLLQSLRPSRLRAGA